MTAPWRWAVVGSRDYPDLEAVRAFVRALPLESVILSGGAKGVDTAAEWAASNRGMTWISYRPRELPMSQRQPGQEWAVLVVAPRAVPYYLPERFSCFRDAALWRNRLLVQESDAVVAYWDGLSPGTRYTIKLARRAGKLWELEPKGGEP